MGFGFDPNPGKHSQTLGIKISSLELSKTFDKSIDLADTIAQPPKEAKPRRKRSYEDSDEDSDSRSRKSSKKANGVKKRDDSESEEDPDIISDEDIWDDDGDADMDPEAKKRKKRMEMIKQHLQLLAEDSFHFLRSEGNRGMGEWSVNYKELGKTMRSLEFEKIVEERFESVGTRLLRIIKDKGKLDEKQVIFSRAGKMIAYANGCSLDREHRASQTEPDPCHPFRSP